MSLLNFFSVQVNAAKLNNDRKEKDIQEKENEEGKKIKINEKIVVQTMKSWISYFKIIDINRISLVRIINFIIHMYLFVEIMYMF